MKRGFASNKKARMGRAMETEMSFSLMKTEALKLAIQAGGSTEQILDAAQKFYAFLSGDDLAFKSDAQASPVQMDADRRIASH